MLGGKIVPPAFIVSPLDGGKRSQWDPGKDWTTKVSHRNYSYALLELYKPDSEYKSGLERNYRSQDWTNSGNARAIVVTDRNLGKGAEKDNEKDKGAGSIHNADKWEGSTAYNDGHTEFSKQHYEMTLQYGNGPATYDSKNQVGFDNLFIDDSQEGGADRPANKNRLDCFMVHTGWAVGNSKDTPEGGSGVEDTGKSEE